MHRQMHAFSYAWSLPVTWQRWRLLSSICHSPKPHVTSKLHGSVFYRRGFIVSQSFTLREWGFSTYFAPVTLTLTRWPDVQTWPVFLGDIPVVQIWISYVKAFESYRLTDR